MKRRKKQCKRFLCSFMFVIILFLCISYTPTAADTVKEQPKVIYLTFDDGPSFIVTDQILDILKEKDVQATFFIVGSKIEERERILKRIHEEGHGLGLHSYTHIAKKVYANHQSLIDEMKRTETEINRIVGVSPKVIRLPGGSKPYLNKALLDKLHQNSYKVYDWNACVSDGINNQAPAASLYNESKRVIGNSKRVILLLHCDQMNKNTCKALPDIIDYYKNEGYEFKIITEETPEFYFRFKDNKAMQQSYDTCDIKL